MPVTLTTTVADELVAAATTARGGCLIDAELDVTEGTSWRYESDPITWSDGLAPEDFVDLTGCTATARVCTEPDGALILTLTTTCTSLGTVVATCTDSQSATIAQANRGDRRAWWECELTIPGGRKLWLWRGPITIRQKGIA